MLWLIGTVLYWAEGTKLKDWRLDALVEFSNTDPRMLLIVRKWLEQYCGVMESDLTYALQIHRCADLRAAREFWEGRLNLPPGRLRIYLKKHNPSPSRRNTGKTYYGTIRMIVRRSVLLNYRITEWIQELAKHWGVG